MTSAPARVNRFGRLLALGAALVALGDGGASAQQAQSPAPASPPPFLQGRAADQANSTLAPHAPPLVAKAGKDIPVDRIKLPAGFQIEVWADKIMDAREMTVSPNGTVFVGSRRQDKVTAILDKGDHREAKIIATGLASPNGVAFHNGALFIAEKNKIDRVDDIEAHLDAPPKPVVIYSDLPEQGNHFWKFIAFGPDNKLYIPVGAPCNICNPPEGSASIRRINADGSGAEIVARGIRNTVGFDWDPKTKELWFTDNGRDWEGDDLPNDELNHATKVGEHFGYPFCHQGDTLDPEFGKDQSCADYTPPAVKLGPHVAALGMRFYTGEMFPAEYKGNIIIAQHGSWNRTKKSGYRLMRVAFEGTGQPKYEVFAEGWLQGEEFWGRPVDVQPLKDGSLLVSDDWNHAIYRISYKKP